MTSEVQIERIEHFIGSSDGTSQLRVLLWIPYLPENELKGIVQIVHGMEEHATMNSLVSSRATVSW